MVEATSYGRVPFRKRKNAANVNLQNAFDSVNKQMFQFINESINPWKELL